MFLPMRGEPKRKAQREVKAKLPNVEMKVIVQERFTSPLNIAVWEKGHLLNKLFCVRVHFVQTQKFD